MKTKKKKLASGREKMNKFWINFCSPIPFRLWPGVVVQDDFFVVFNAALLLIIICRGIKKICGQSNNQEDQLKRTEKMKKPPTDSSHAHGPKRDEIERRRRRLR